MSVMVKISNSLYYTKRGVISKLQTSQQTALAWLSQILGQSHRGDRLEPLTKKWETENERERIEVGV